MRVLITGSAGFIGSSVAHRLMAPGDSVLGIDNLNFYYDVSLKQARLTDLASKGGELFSFKKVDFARLAELEAALADEQFGRIFHLGAQAGVRYSIENPHAYVEANIVGHVNMLEIACHRQLEHECGRKAKRELLPMQAGDVARTDADIEAIASDLGYAPTTAIDEGVPRFVRWYRDYHYI